MRLSRATRPKNGEAARFGLLQSASELRLIGTCSLTPLRVKRSHVVAPTDPRNGWSARKLLEKDWSLFVRRLNALPTSAKAARLTASPMIGMRYSRFASTCVSPPTEVNERGRSATLAPLVPVNKPRFTAPADKPGTGTGVCVGFSASTTLRDVMKVSTGAIGLIERTL